jgi:hypothetical protein
MPARLHGRSQTRVNVTTRDHYSREAVAGIARMTCVLHPSDMPRFSHPPVNLKVPYGGPTSNQVKHWKELRVEKPRLRRAVSDLTFDKMILKAHFTEFSGSLV